LAEVNPSSLNDGNDQNVTEGIQPNKEPLAATHLNWRAKNARCLECFRVQIASLGNRDQSIPAQPRLDEVQQTMEPSADNIALLSRILLGLIALAVITLVIPIFRRRSRAAFVSNSLVIISLLFFAYTILQTRQGYRWVLIVGLLPTILVANQAFFLWLYQPKQTTQKLLSPESGWEEELLFEYKMRALDAVGGHFGLSTLTIRYMFPAVLL